LFACSLPIAATAAFVANWIEVKTDAFKLMYIFQKPVPRGAEDIGLWSVRVCSLVGCAVCLSLSLFLAQFISHHCHCHCHCDDMSLFVIIKIVLNEMNCALLYLARQDIFTILAGVACITNAGLTVFTMDVFEDKSDMFRMWFFILFQWGCFTIQVGCVCACLRVCLCVYVCVYEGG
jgi:hypothetical protein